MNSLNKYLELKTKHQQEFNDFPMFFAFDDEQFEKGMATLGLNPDQTDMIYKFEDTGGFYRRSDAPKLYEMLTRHERERKDALSADSTGDGYIYQMFLYELRNHEYGYTGDLEDTLEALGITVEEINADKRLLHGLRKAQQTIWKEGD